ncbi:hypothetical protein QYE76_023119 [Lolium multiflorum]|uniref:Uncharacterized protein n=1 Tax=Lolium multiflorum TaxID=4521 RepID=A0AAD8RAT5_LOLMU|nr:hypothetical protein QYE76_023119 [Lolium multiflorum]
MVEHNLSWDQVVQMCRQAHPEDEQLVADAFQADQLGLEAAEADAAERAQARERLAAARAEIADARVEIAEARAAMAAPPAAPPADAVIHDIAVDANDDDVVPARFRCDGDQLVLVVSFETVAGDVLAVRLGQRRRKPTTMQSPWLGGTCAPTWIRSRGGALLPRGSSRRTGSWRAPSPPGTKQWRRR